MSTQHTSITLYGIPNCDTVKKARAWLTAQGVDYQFHDFKKQGIPTDRVPAWQKAVGWEKLVNRQGTTWRKLDASVQARVSDAISAAALMSEQPSIIKRPVVEWGRAPASIITVGFDENAWNEALKGASKA
ncbi:MAG: ArsC family reductase [Comamonadaceae bacterium]|nr:MAG: ArsC family reductase [Comamonadaceae bacterium]